MNNKYIYIVLLVFISGLNILVAQSNADNDTPAQTAPQNMFGVPQEVQSKVNGFFKFVFQKDYEEAYDLLLENSPLKENKKDLAKLVSETKRINKYYGKLRGYEFVNSEAVTKSYIRIRCLGLCEKFPTRWVFTYYKSPKYGWIVISVTIDDLSEYYFSD